MLVGKEAFCDYHTIQEAVDSLERQPSGNMETLYILSGVYEEAVRIYLSNLHVIGIGRVEIKMNRYAKEKDGNGEDIGTFATPTLFIGGRRILVDNIVVTNSAGQGEQVGQAIAVYAHCDETVFRGCVFKGFQDTLFTGPLPPAPKERRTFGGIPLKEQHVQYRQLYQNCSIEGTVDFIFGGAAAYFEHCEIHSLLHIGQQPGYITAASTPQGQEHGYVFNRCYLTADNGVSEVYLGRPWREYAKTDFVNCRMGGHIHPSGWDNWGDPVNEATVRYREFGVPDAAALRLKRVPWAGCFEAEEEKLLKEHVFKGTEFWKMEAYADNDNTNDNRRDT